MLKLNEEYSINSGQGTIVFNEGNNGTVNAEYEIKGNKGKGKINGTLENEILKATFHVDAAAGLIEFTFTANGFDAKWKQGIESGPMKGKWTGSLKSQSASNQSINEKTSLSPEQLKWIEEGSWDFKNAPKEWLDSKKFMLSVVTNDGRDLKYASAELKADRELVMEAIKNDISSIDYADEKLKCDPQLLIARIIVHFDGEENISISNSDINIFVDGSDFYDPQEAIGNLLLKLEYIVLKNNKEEFESFHKKIIALVNANHECFWIFKAVSKRLISFENNNSSWYEEKPDHYTNMCNLTHSFKCAINFEPSIEFETYFNDSEINSNWDDCKWTSDEAEEGLPFTEFIMDKTGMEWDTESWSDVKYYNNAISMLWIGVQNYSLKQTQNSFDSDEFAVLFHEVIAEKYESIQDSGNGHYCSNVFETMVEFLLGIPKNDYNLNESDREDLEDFNGWQYDLKKIGLECDCDLFDEWPGATKFAKK